MCQHKAQVLYVSPLGNDHWSGQLAEPSGEGTDGPLATIEMARWKLVHAFSWNDWKALGNDRHSLVADPPSRHLGAYDFGLLPDAPAFGLGFEPIDVSDAGSRPKGTRD